VLGGGGARGAAHIGVLRELERMHIPVDAIVGTSMGAIVGGLYASGMTPDDLETLVASMDWAGALSDEPARADLRLRRKQDAEKYPIDLDLGLDDGRLRLPLGVVQGQKLDLLLRELTDSVAHITEFDELSIPFRAVATDIETGRMHVMERGDLALALRASMSVPGLLAPVPFDDRLLVDGGLVGNLPIDVIRDMGVDVVIAVDVEFPLYGVEELRSAINISEQVLTLLIHNETLRQIEALSDDDILIRPELGTFGSSDFGAILDTVEPGAVAARSAAERLQALALDEADYQAWRDRRRPQQSGEERLAFVRVAHDTKLAPEVLKSRLGVAAGDPLDAAALTAAAEKLHALSIFEKVDYSLVREGAGTGVVFNAQAKTWGPNFLRFGVSLEDDFEGATNFDLRTRLTRPAVNRLGGEWRVDLRLGTEPQLFAEFYQPLRYDSRLFVAPSVDLDQSNINLFAADDIIARLRLSEITGGIDVGAEFGSAGELRVGAYRGGGESRVIVGDPLLPNPDFATGGLRASLSFDTFDQAWFPRTGLRGTIEWKQSLPGFGADDRYDRINLGVETVRSRGKSTLGIGVEYATTLSSAGSLQDLFRMGGFQRLSGLERNALTGPHAALAKLLFYRRIGNSPGGLFEAPVYLGATLEAGNVWDSRSSMSFASALLHGSLFVGVDSYIGPLILAAGVGEGGRSNFYLFIGAQP